MVTWKIVELVEASVLYIIIIIIIIIIVVVVIIKKKKKLSVTCSYTTHVSVYQAQNIY